MKKISILLCLLVLTVNIFAANNVVSDSGQSIKTGTQIDSENIEVQPVIIGSKQKVAVVNPFAGAWGFYLNIIVVLGGGMMLLRFAVELVGAIVFSTEDSTVEVRKVLVRFLVHLGVVMMSFGVIALIF